MGASFVNYQILSSELNKVTESVAKLIQSKAYVSLPKNNWITLYDEESDNEFNYYEIHYMCQQISLDLSTTVIALLVYTDLYLLYFLYNNGECIDEYHSNPDGFAFGFELADDSIHKKLEGNPYKLLEYCLIDLDVTLLIKTLHPLHEMDVFSKGRHAACTLASLLGIDQARSSLGFRYFEEDNVYAEEPDLKDFQDFQLLIADAPA